MRGREKLFNGSLHLHPGADLPLGKGKAAAQAPEIRGLMINIPSGYSVIYIR